MTWIVFTVLLGIVFWGGIIFWIATKPNPDAPKEESRYGSSPASVHGWGLAVAGITAVIWVSMSLYLSFHLVGQREVAIVYNFSGTISGKKDAGVANTMPWQHIKKENVGIRHDEWAFSIDDSSAAVSKDQQRIGALLSVNYQIDPENVVDLYKRVGASWKTIIIDARVPQVFKEVTSKYPTAQITADREQLRIDTKERLTQELQPYDIKVVDVFIKNLGFSQSYTDAIEAKQRQVQDAQRAQAKVVQVQAEAQQKIAEAKGEATANIERARGESVANKLRQRSLTPLLIQQQAIEKLNPDVQVVYCAPNVFCVPNGSVVPGSKP